jgi:hypothetical protein
MRVKMKKALILSLAMALSLSVSSYSSAAIDLQSDLNRIVVAIKKFDANSLASTNVSSMNEVRQIFSNNNSILREIENANNIFKKDLLSARKYIPTSDTKNSPAFNTFFNLALGYEQWIKFQNLNQINAQSCINKSANSFGSFSKCSISMLAKTLENEQNSRRKLQQAWNAWKAWQIKYGYA